MPAFANPTIRLGGNDYVLAAPIQIERILAWPEALRVVGNQRPTDRVNTDQWLVDDFSKGIGYFVAKSSNPDSLKAAFSSTLETRWKGQVTLPGLVETASKPLSPTVITSNPGGTLYNRFFAHSSYIYAATITGSTYYGSNIIRYSSSAWSLSKELNTSPYIANGGPLSCSTAVAHNGHLYFYGSLAGNHPTTVKLTLAEPAIWTDVTPTTNFTNRVKSVVSFNDTMYALTEDASTATSDQYFIEQSTNDGATWSLTGASISTGPASEAELIIYFDSVGEPAIYAVMDSGVYIFDVADAELRPVIKYANNIKYFSPRRPKVFNGRLYVCADTRLYEFYWRDGTWKDISPIANLSTDLGYVNVDAIADGEGQWLFAAFNGTVMAYDIRESGDTPVWHFIGSMGQQVYDMIIHEGNLHLVLLDGTFRIISNVITDPLRTSGKKFAASGTLVSGHFSSDMPEVNGNLIQTGLSGSGLTSTETIQVETAVNYSTSYEASPNVLTWNDGTTINRKYGSSAGLPARVWSHKLTFSRGSTNTNTPVLYQLTDYYEKLYSDLHQYTVLIDLAETSNAHRAKYPDASSVMNVLHDVVTSSTLVSLQYPGMITHGSTTNTRYVRVAQYQTREIPDNIPESILQRIVEGSVVMFQLKEVV